MSAKVHNETFTARIGEPPEDLACVEKIAWLNEKHLNAILFEIQTSFALSVLNNGKGKYQFTIKVDKISEEY